MKKITLFLFLCLISISCDTSSYYYESGVQNVGLNFKSGKWLLTGIDAPNEINGELTALVLNKFKRHLHERLDYVYDVKGIMLPKKTPLNPTKSNLAAIKKGTGYDYLINVKASGISDGNSVDISNGKGKENEYSSYIVVEVYDLNNLEIIYSRRENGLKKFDKKINKGNMSKLSNKMIIRAFEYIWKNLRKTSIK
ncbi:MAG TPA: hypothetical protein VK528_09310 [Flavobacterium sp.]|nr:hypothetical protein [Flavobacterium sp.]